MADAPAEIKPILALNAQTRGLCDFLRLTWRLEKLCRWRWQWFSMLAIMFALRLQHDLPPEIMVALLFVIFLIFPLRTLVRVGR
jgi:hypothetical protein